MGKQRFSIALKVAGAKDVIYHLYGSHNGETQSNAKKWKPLFMMCFPMQACE